MNTREEELQAKRREILSQIQNNLEKNEASETLADNDYVGKLQSIINYINQYGNPEEEFYYTNISKINSVLDALTSESERAIFIVDTLYRRFNILKGANDNPLEVYQGLMRIISDDKFMSLEDSKSMK